jgi:hypothetical protein
VVGRVAVAACAAALLLVPGAAAQDALPGGRAIFATASISPDTHLFAEPVAARVDIVLDPAQLDPDRIQVRMGRFAPYEPLGPVEKERTDAGELVRLRFTARLRCLDVRCLAPRYRTVLGEQEGGRPERYNFRFSPAQILYEENQRPQLLLARAFPVLEVVSRINSAQLDAADQPGAAGSGYTASLEPPAPTYRMSPEWIAAVALGAAFVLFLLPATVAARFAHSRWKGSRRPRRLSPLERALVLVEWTGRRADGEHERRKALEALADALELEGARQLAEATRTYAWGEESPAPERAQELAAQAKTTLAGGSNGRPA